VTVSTGGSPAAVVEVQPVRTMNDTAIQPNTVAKRTLLAGFIRPLRSCKSTHRPRRQITLRRLPELPSDISLPTGRMEDNAIRS
jgi:hypothetical protein